MDQVSPAATGSPVSAPSAAPAETLNATVPSAARPLEAAPVVLETVAIPAGSIAQYYPYTLNGKTHVIPLTLSTSVYVDYQNKAEPPANGGNDSYYRAYISDTEQQPTIAALAAAIKGITANPSDEARIATSIVQHIPSYEGPVHIPIRGALHRGGDEWRKIASPGLNLKQSGPRLGGLVLYR